MTMHRGRIRPLIIALALLAVILASGIAGLRRSIHAWEEAGYPSLRRGWLMDLGVNWGWSPIDWTVLTVLCLVSTACGVWVIRCRIRRCRG